MNTETVLQRVERGYEGMSEARALRELVRCQAAQLERIRGLARRAELALLDHDLEMVGMCLRQMVPACAGMESDNGGNHERAKESGNDSRRTAGD